MQNERHVLIRYVNKGIAMPVKKNKEQLKMGFFCVKNIHILN